MPAGSVEVDQVGVGEDVRVGQQRAHDELGNDQNPDEVQPDGPAASPA